MLRKIIGFLRYLLFLLKMCLRRKSPLEPPFLSEKVPILGHYRILLGDSAFLWQNCKKITKECMQRGGALTLKLGPHFLYFLTDPEDCLTVSNACLNKDYIYKFIEPLLGESIFSANFEKWKVHRKLLNPAFNQNVLNSFMDIFNSQARRLADQLAVEVTRVSCDIGEYLSENLLETICKTSIGEISEINSFQTQYISYIKEMLHIFIERFLKLWLHLDLFFNMSELKKRTDKLAEKINGFSDAIIQQKKEMHIVTSNEHDTIGKSKPFMNLILELANQTGCFSDENVRAETAVNIIAGYETSATILTYAFILIGSYPEVQRKVYEEILQVFDNTDRDVEKGDLGKLVYIDAVLKETMRLYPVAPIVARHIDKEVRLKNYTLKPGSSCFISIMGVHRHPMWGTDVEFFRPERWLESTIPDGKYFGGFMFGKRSCIGRLYATMSMKTIVTHVLRRYQIKADFSKLEMKLDMLLKPVVGHHIKLELRE